MKQKCKPYAPGSNDKKGIDETLARFIIRGLQPLCIVEDIGFVEFVRRLDKRYILPSRRTLRDVLISKAYESTAKSVCTILSDAQ